MMQNKKEYDLLISSISHEIRNPVTLINSYLQLIAADHPEVKDFEYWDTVIQEMDHLKYLLADLSAFNNGMFIKPISTNLICWMNSYYSSGESLIHSITAHASLILDLPKDLPSLNLDHGKFRQVLDNLLRNAAEAISVHPDSSLSGKISVTVRSHNDTVKISVADNGCGIFPEDIPKLFNPFFSNKANGTGLGLTLSDRIIKAHHGAISVHSEPLKGTEFVITLPALT